VQCNVFLTAQAVPSQTHVHGIQNVLVAERLREKFDGARLHRLHAHRDVAVSRDEHDRELEVARGEIALEIEPAAPGHPHVQNQAGGAVGSFSLQEVGDRREQVVPEADGAQQSPERFPKGGVVVDHHHAVARLARQSLSRFRFPGTVHRSPSERAPARGLELSRAAYCCIAREERAGPKPRFRAPGPPRR
jgi:hypothetical protein